MYFKVIEPLLKLCNKDMIINLEAIDDFLFKLKKQERKHVRVSFISQKLNIHPDITRNILVLLVHLGVLKPKFHYECPFSNAGIDYFEENQEIPQEIYCDICDENHIVNTEDLKVVYELIERS